MITSYTLEEWNSIQWPQTPQAHKLKTYLSPFYEQGVTNMMHNVHTDIGVLIIDDIALPFSIGARGHRCSYVCSPQSQYVEYAKEELFLLKSNTLKVISCFFIYGLQHVCSWGQLDTVIIINNWLLSTNPYPDLKKDHISTIIEHIQRTYPHHTIMFRSIDLGLRAHMHTMFVEKDFRMILSRRVHILFGNNEHVWKKKDIKKDIRLQHKTPYTHLQHDDLKPSDFERIKELYDKLYIDKYSDLNPQFSVAYLRHLWQEKIWTFTAFEKEGRIDSVCATFDTGAFQIGPLIGYDTRIPQKEGLYRLAYMDMIAPAQKSQQNVHCSAGVALYKQQRGAESFFEYSAVYIDHLPWYRRLPWKLIQIIMDKFVQPMMLQNNL